MKFLRSCYRALIATAHWFQPVFLLVLRLFLGVAFWEAGSGKLMHIDAFINFLTTLPIPAPGFTAYFVATVEAVGGISLLIGFGARLMGLILTINMMVAYLTAHMEAVWMLWSHPGLFVAQEAFLYLLGSAVIFAFGPGLISVDGALKRYVFRERIRP